MKSITFFFPYPYISGVPILFANIANYLLENSDIEINIIDYSDGALARTCNKSFKLNHIIFEDFKPLHLEIETLLVLQAGIPYKLRNELIIGDKVKVLQWAAFEYNLVPYIYQVNAFRKLQEKYFALYLIFWYLDLGRAKALSKWVKDRIEEGSVVFMSRKMYEVTAKYLRFPESDKMTFLPLVSGGVTQFTSSVIDRKIAEIEETVEMAWVGRIGDFKVHILNYTILQAAAWAEKLKRKTRFHIIGDGEFGDILDTIISNNYFSIINVGGLEKNDSDKYTLDHVHILFAMGTSSIDGARVGLPVVLLDYTYTPVKVPYVFRYLHHTKNYDLGHPITDSDCKEGNNSFDILLGDIVSNYAFISSQCLEYYNVNHSTKETAKKLIQLGESKGYYVKDIPPILTKTSIMRRAYLLYLKNIKKKYY
jgi:hypothetical protein